MSESIGKAEPSLQRHVVRGALWVIALRWNARLTGLVSTIILARLLTPADYGIVTIAMLIVGTIEVLSQTGQTLAIIRHPNPTREHLDSAWTLSLLIGLGLALLILAATPLTTVYFHEPRAAAVVEILAFRTVLSGVENIAVVNFARDLRFHKQFWLSIYPNFIAFAVTVTAAFWLRNYWALVIGILIEQVSAIVLGYVMAPYRPRICFTKVNEIWSFSIWTLFKGIGYYINSKIDQIAIGGIAGAAGMGRYEVGLDLAISPTQELVAPMLSVVFPVMATVQGDKEKRRTLYMNVLYWCALICTSTSIGVALVASDMVDLVLGSQWNDVKPLMPWLALAFGILGMSNSVYSAFDSIGRPVISARLQWMRVICLGLAVFPVAYYMRSLKAVAVARFFVTLAITPTLFAALGRTLGLSTRDFFVILWRPMVSGFGMAIIVLVLNATITFTGTPRLLLDVALGAVSYVAVLMLLWVLVGQPEGPEKMLCVELHTRLVRLGWKRGLTEVL